MGKAKKKKNETPPTYWTYRLVREKGLITIREVYFQDGSPWLCDQGDKPFGGESLEDVKELYNWAGNAFNAKILDYPKDFTRT
jgi:hypothetical protein